MEKALLNKTLFRTALALAGLPLVMILLLSLLNTTPPATRVSLDGYRELFTALRLDELLRITGRSLLISLLATGAAFALAFLLYRFVAERFQPVFLLAVTLPFLVNDAVRIFAWQNVLQGNGLLNSTLSILTLRQNAFFNATNNWNVYLVMLLDCIPFGIFIFTATFKTFPVIYWRAANDLKISRPVRLVKIVVPLCSAGFLASFIVIFFVSFSMSSEVNFLGGDTKISTRNLVNSLMSASKFQAIFALGALIILVILSQYALYRSVQNKFSSK